MSKSVPTGMPECKENFLSRVYITGEYLVHVPLPDMMPRRPILPGAPTIGPLHPGGRLLLQIMCTCTPFSSRVRPPEHARLPVTLLWSDLLALMFPRCPPTRGDPARATRGLLRLHTLTPPHLRKAPAPRCRGRLRWRPTMSPVPAAPRLNTSLIIHNPLRNIRALRRTCTNENSITHTNTPERGHPDGRYARQIRRSVLRGGTLRHNLSALYRKLRLKIRIRISRLTLPRIWKVIAEASTMARHRVEPRGVKSLKKKGEESLSFITEPMIRKMGFLSWSVTVCFSPPEL